MPPQVPNLGSKLDVPSGAAQYSEAGVSLERADRVVEIAKAQAQRTQQLAQQQQHNHASITLLNAIGGFASAFTLPEGYTQPVLLSSCDGVGTKLKWALEWGAHHAVGQDLVAMSVNDVLVHGGRPLAFLDYYATGRIAPEVFEEVLKGIAEACTLAGCALVGGETAEMPGMYAQQDYDLAGFCLGIVEKSKMLPKINQIQPGDVLIGLTASGFHSNGYSLLRHLFPDTTVIPEAMRDAFMRATPIYVPWVQACLNQFPEAVLAAAHITGGGLLDNLPRVLPLGVNAVFDWGSWPLPQVMQWVCDEKQVSRETLTHTFNAGLGFVLIVRKEQATALLEFFSGLLSQDSNATQNNICAYRVGSIQAQALSSQATASQAAGVIIQ